MLLVASFILFYLLSSILCNHARQLGLPFHLLWGSYTALTNMENLGPRLHILLEMEITHYSTFFMICSLLLIIQVELYLFLRAFELDYKHLCGSAICSFFLCLCYMYDGYLVCLYLFKVVVEIL